MDDELVYASRARGFALASMCNPMLSRYDDAPHFPDQGVFDRQMQDVEIETLKTSADARRMPTENYTGLPC